MEKTSNPTKFTSKIEDQQQKFEKLLHDFHTHDDPVLRYIKRLQMREIQGFLADNNIEVVVP